MPPKTRFEFLNGDVQSITIPDNSLIGVPSPPVSSSPRSGAWSILIPSLDGGLTSSHLATIKFENLKNKPVWILLTHFNTVNGERWFTRIPGNGTRTFTYNRYTPMEGEGFIPYDEFDTPPELFATIVYDNYDTNDNFRVRITREIEDIVCDNINFVIQPSYTEDCTMRPTNSVCLLFDDGYVRFQSNTSIIGWDNITCPGNGDMQVAFGASTNTNPIVYTGFYHIPNTNGVGTFFFGETPPIF